MFEPLDVFAKVEGAPLSFKWQEQHRPWLSDGARTPTVKKLEGMSVRAGLALSAVSLEWMMHRLWSTSKKPSAARPASWNRAIAAIWSEILRPGSFDRAAIALEAVGKEKIDEPVREYVNGTFSTIGVARDFDGAFHSYLESSLRLADYVMPNTAYKSWRTKAYAMLTDLSGAFCRQRIRHDVIGAKAHLMKDVQAMFEQDRKDHEAQERIVEQQGVGALWGPIVLREELVSGVALDGDARRDAIARLEKLTGVSAA